MNKLLFIIFLLVSAGAQADVIKFISGNVLEATVIERTEETIKIEAGAGMPVTYYFDEIESINGVSVSPRPSDKELNSPDKIKASAPAETETRILYEKAKYEYSAGNYETALELLEDALDFCLDKHDKLCLDANIYYLVSAIEYLESLNEDGEYQKIFDVSVSFAGRFEFFPKFEVMLDSFLKAEQEKSHDPGLRNEYLDYLARGYSYLIISLASKNKMTEAERYLEELKKFDPLYAQKMNVQTEAFKDIFSDPVLNKIFNTLLRHQVRLSVIYRLPSEIKPLYQKFKAEDVNDEKKFIRDLKSNVNRVKNEIYREDEYIKDEYSGLFFSLIDSTADEFSRGFFGDKNVRHSDEVNKSYHGLFKCSFISFINQIILETIGVEVKSVKTKDKKRLTNNIKYRWDGFIYSFNNPTEVWNIDDHVLSLIILNNGKVIFADFLNDWVSGSFNLAETYEHLGKNYYELAAGIDDKKLYSHFQLSKDPLTDIYSNLAGLSYRLKENEYCAYFIKKIKKNDENSFYLYSLLFQESYYALKQFEDAARYSLMEIEIYRNNPPAYYGLCIAYDKMKKHQEAIDACEMALALDNKYFCAYPLLGFNYAKLNNFDKSVEYYQKCLKSNHSVPTAHENLFRIYYDRGNSFLARKHLKQAIKLYEAENNHDKTVEMKKLLMADR